MKNKPLWIGSLMLFVLLFAMVVGPYLPGIDHELKRHVLDLTNGMKTPPFPPSHTQWLGSDDDGRDMFSLIVIGARETLLLVFAITAIRYVIAVPLGVISYQQKGLVHRLLRGWNQLFSGLPTLFSAVLLMNLPFLVFAKHRLFDVLLIIALIEVGRVAFIFQQRTHSLSKEPFVESGIVVGNAPFALFRRYFLPFLLPEVAVNFFLDMGRVMLLFGQLGILNIFLSQTWLQTSFGVGELHNTSNNWSTLLTSARTDILTSLWVPFFPALAITFAILSFNLIGEGLRKHFERRTSS